MKNNVIIYIPVEQVKRDLIPKLFLATRAALCGYEVVLGHRSRIEALSVQMRPGIYLDRSLVGKESVEQRLKKLKSCGFVIASLEVEALLPFSYPELFTRLRFSQTNIDTVDAIFTWTKTEAEVITNEFKGVKGRIFITGSPQFDVLKKSVRQVFEQKAAEIKSDLGSFVLVNLNATFNPRGGSSVDQGKIDIRHNRILRNGGTQKDIDTSNQKRYNTSQLNVQMIEDISSIAREHPELRFVFRPHPSEDAEEFRKQWKLPSNCVVRHEGSVIPWLMAASTMVHAYCTTAIESAVIGKISICYDPSMSEYQTLPQARVSKQIATKEELLVAVSTDLHSNSAARVSEVLSGEFGSIEEDEFAADEILRQIERLVPRVLSSRKPCGIGSLVQRTKLRIANRLRQTHRNEYFGKNHIKIIIKRIQPDFHNQFKIQTAGLQLIRFVPKKQ